MFVGCVCWLLVVSWLLVGDGCLLVVDFLVVGGLLVFDYLSVVCWLVFCWLFDGWLFIFC